MRSSQARFNSDAILSGRYSNVERVVEQALGIMKEQAELEAWIDARGRSD